MELRVPASFKIENNHVVASFDPIDPAIGDSLSIFRSSICKKCDSFKTEKGACEMCGCSMSYPSRLIYPLDENGKAIKRIDPNGKYEYVCKLKKW